MLESTVVDSTSPTISSVMLGWWNTALAPLAQPRSREDDKDAEDVATAALVVEHLVNLGLDCIVLCEVCTEYIEILRAELIAKLPDYVFLDMTSKAGRGVFDTAIIYRSDIMDVVDSTDIFTVDNNETTRIGQHFKLSLSGCSAPLHLIASHWPSRQTLEQRSHKRNELGLRLREKVVAIIDDEAEASIVLLGDYNDEPFDSSMADSLRATRDRNFMLQTDKVLMYNPFWRHMSSYSPVDSALHASDKGTYFHKPGTITRWHTFDHMMFSPSLLKGLGEWILDEHLTRVVDMPDYAKLVESRVSIFDHLPIMCRLARSN
jgi:hypothetical protein